VRKDSLLEFIADELLLSLTDNAVEMSEKKAKKSDKCPADPSIHQEVSSFHPEKGLHN